MWTIYLKEILELLRDRKTLIFTLVIPVLVMPLFGGSFGYASYRMSRNAMEATLPYAVFGERNAPSLAARFTEAQGYRRVALADENQIRAAIEDGTIKFALVIPQAPAAANTSSNVALHYNAAASVDAVSRRVQATIEQENTALRRQAASALGLPAPQLAYLENPIVLERRSIADRREQLGEVVGRILPYILLLVCLLAAMYPAIDIGAGENERGTLESLLLAPVSRSSIVLAKFGVIFTTGLTSALLMVGSIGVLARAFGDRLDPGLQQMVKAIGAADLVMLALMLVPTAAIFAAILLSISLYAKSFKEAQGFIQPMMILFFLPIMAAMLPGVSLNWAWALVPLTNVSLAMREIVKGTMDYRMFGLIVLSSTVVAGAALLYCRAWSKREDVLFRN
jgi:sodium transport system permease protein